MSVVVRLRREVRFATGATHDGVANFVHQSQMKHQLCSNLPDLEAVATHELQARNNAVIRRAERCTYMGFEQVHVHVRIT